MDTRIELSPFVSTGVRGWTGEIRSIGREWPMWFLGFRFVGMDVVVGVESTNIFARVSVMIDYQRTLSEWKKNERIDQASLGGFGECDNDLVY